MRVSSQSTMGISESLSMCVINGTSVSDPNIAAAWPKLKSQRVRKTSKLFLVDEHYEYISTRGVGSYGVVISARDTRTNTCVAIKKVSDAWYHTEDGLRVLREMVTLQHLQHENIVRLIDMVPPALGAPLNDVYLVLELLDTDLGKIIASPQALGTDHVQFFLYQVLKALKYIHSAGIVHRDIKPSNLVINRDCTLKVCDFGLSRYFHRALAVTSDAPESMTEYVVTRWYRAPELLCGSRDYDGKIDIWAAGCVLGELLLRRPLFPGKNIMHQLELILNVLGTPCEEDIKAIHNQMARAFVASHKASAQNWSHVLPKAPPAALDLLSRMLQFNPAKRISAPDALKHPFLAPFHNAKYEPDCSRPFDTSMYRLKFDKKQMLQDFAWEELFKFRPHLRPPGRDSPTAKYFEALHSRSGTASKRKAEDVISADSCTRDDAVVDVHVPVAAVDAPGSLVGFAGKSMDKNAAPGKA